MRGLPEVSYAYFTCASRLALPSPLLILVLPATLADHPLISMSDETPLIRQWRLLKLLSSRHYGATVRELADETHVNEKTIRRDLQTFQQAGFPLEESVGDHGRKNWKIRVGKEQPELGFALDEALALYLGRRFLDPLAGTLFWEAAQSAFRKIRACLGKAAIDYLEKIAGRLHHRVVGASDYSAKADLIDQLMQGIEDQRQTFLVYRSQRATEPVTSPIYPYGLTFFRSSLYLVAYSVDHDEIRHYKVDRIEEVDVTNLPFNRPDDFDLETHLAGSFGVFQGKGNVIVKVWFSSVVSRYVTESVWHASQQLAPQRDGSVLATFHLTTTEEISRWILSFGKHAKALEPAELCQRIKEEAQAVCDSYPSQDEIGTDASSRRVINLRKKSFK